MKSIQRKKKNEEAKITELITSHLINKGYLVVRVNSSNRFSQESKMPIRSYIIKNINSSSGFPDLLAMKKNKVLLIEVKASKGRQTTSQKIFEQLANQHEVTYIIAKNLDDIKEFLE